MEIHLRGPRILGHCMILCVVHKFCKRSSEDLQLFFESSFWQKASPDTSPTSTFVTTPPKPVCVWSPRLLRRLVWKSKVAFLFVFHFLTFFFPPETLPKLSTSQKFFQGMNHVIVKIYKTHSNTVICWETSQKRFNYVFGRY